MISRMVSLLAAIAGLVLLAGVGGCSRSDASPPAGGAQASLERGKYLVENVGLCSDCHTPRLQDGTLDRDRWLMGSMVEFTPIHPIPGWATVAPAIAGLASFTDEEAVALLESGVAPGGRPLAPPMPPFRLNHDDAVAVVAYLRTLGDQ